MDRQEGLKRLREPFPKEQIEKKALGKGGPYLDYVGHAQTWDRILSVDPEANYTFPVCNEDGSPKIHGQADDSIGMWLDLTILGITRRGYGTAKAQGGRRILSDLVKELIGDAIRNAAMRFGVALELWAKVPLERHDDEPETKPEGGSKGPDLDDTGAFDTEGVLKYAGVPCPDATNWTWGTVKQTKVGGKSTYKAYTWGQMWQDEAQRTWMNERLADAQAKTAKQERVVPALQRAVFAYQHLVSDAMREADKIEAAKAFKEGTKPGGDPQATAAGLDFNKTGDGSATEAMRDH